MFIKSGDISFSLIILLIYPAGIIPARITSYYYNSNPYFYLFMFFISHFLLLFVKLFYKLRDCCGKKKSNSIELRTKSQSTILENYSTIAIDLIVSEQVDYTKQKLLSILFIGILYFISYTFFYYSNFITTTNFYGNISMITELIYFSLFNRIIFGNKLYSHHLFSMILITISILGLYILLIIKFIEDNNCQVFRDIIFPSILNFVVYLIFCYDLVKAKQLIEKYFITPFLLIFSLGFLGLILLLLFEPITFVISCDYPVMCYEGHFAGIISGFNQISNIKQSIIVFSGLILLFMTVLGLWLTIIYLSPSHFLTSDSIITIGLNIMIDCYSGRIMLLKNPLFYILSLLTIFGCLIYNEIIIINLFGLNHNTRKEIIKRESEESGSSGRMTFDMREDTFSDDSDDEIEIYQ